MSEFRLFPHQLEALPKIKNGCILWGGVGSGKSLTALAYYYLRNGGDMSFLIGDGYAPMDDVGIKDLYIITTALKRDKLEWESELKHYCIYPTQNLYSNRIVIDSWNNIKKYKDVKNAFFIFDEDRVTGNGVWVKTFLKISKFNEWIILSATPGDTWNDYIPVFLANGFYKNKKEFNREHVVFSRFVDYPKVDRYINTRRLVRLRNSILIPMPDNRHTVPHHETLKCHYDFINYRITNKNRWDPFKEQPIETAAELCYLQRKIVNSDPSRATLVKQVHDLKKKVIVFYNFDYELDILKSIDYGEETKIAEWNGHKHQEIPEGKDWVYLVQYTAGCEGWNCVKTDTIIFYSQNYSYKVMEQASGRINRLNTPYRDLYYYHLKSDATIDLAIGRALAKKKKFNEGKYARNL